MPERTAQFNLLLDLETRHEKLLADLDELDRRVEKTLIECLALRNPGSAIPRPLPPSSVAERN